MILEGVVTTIGPDGALNVAPMGPEPGPDGEWTWFTLRPFRSSTTYRNLKGRGEGVLHVTDDVLLMAKAAIGPVPDAATRPAEAVEGRVLLSCARYYEFRVAELDDREDRTRIVVETVAFGRLGDLFGLNRAKHAVVEAAILATRLGLLPIEQIRREIDLLEPLVIKTGGPTERTAFDLLRSYIVAKEIHG